MTPVEPGSRPCAETARLGRMALSAPDARLREHLASCAACDAEWAALQRLRALAGELVAPAGRASRREQARGRLLAAAAEIRPAWETAGRREREGGRARRVVGLGAVAAMAAVAAVAGVVVVGKMGVGVGVGTGGAGAVASRSTNTTTTTNATTSTNTSTSMSTSTNGNGNGNGNAGEVARKVERTRRGRVVPNGHARFTWSSSPDEVVRLAEGEVSIEVDPLRPGERFRVMSGDAEIEVHGTAFKVLVARNRLVSVNVVHGLVEVRHAGGAPALLGPTQRWLAPLPAVEPVARRTGRAPGQAEVAFADGWHALRAGSYAEAATSFAEALRARPGGSLAEDAHYWRGVALARAGHPAEARASMASFLDRYPRAARAGEVAAMLGWLLVDARDEAEAARRFAVAARDRTPKVRASAEAGLAAVNHAGH